MMEIPQYCLRAYALFFSKHGSREQFSQRELDWIVSPSMRKKVFALLLRSGWIVKDSRETYKCKAPEKVFRGLLEFKVPGIVREATRPYAFTGMSAIEVWSDYSYVQRSMEKSPYFIKVLRKDLGYWKRFLNEKGIPNYFGMGSTIGEYVILVPVDKIESVEKDGFKVEPLKATLKKAQGNELFNYACDYMREKYGVAAA